MAPLLVTQLSFHGMSCAFPENSPQDSIPIKRIKQLLKGGTMNLRQIAIIGGFSPQSHLHHRLKNWTGVTPKIFLQKSVFVGE